MTTRNSKAPEDARIREQIEHWEKALRAKDIDGVVSHYATNVLTFDLAPPLQYRGADAYRKILEEWFPTFQGPIGYEIHDLTIATSGDIAFSHSLNHLSGKRTGGEDTAVWVRATVCYRKIDGKWLVAHEHVSVPFYMDGSYKAAVDLKP